MTRLAVVAERRRGQAACVVLGEPPRAGTARASRSRPSTVHEQFAKHPERRPARSREAEQRAHGGARGAAVGHDDERAARRAPRSSARSIAAHHPRRDLGAGLAAAGPDVLAHATRPAGRRRGRARARRAPGPARRRRRSRAGRGRRATGRPVSRGERRRPWRGRATRSDETIADGPSTASIVAARSAWASPTSSSGTSSVPWNRPSSFQAVRPCRSRTTRRPLAQLPLPPTRRVRPCHRLGQRDRAGSPSRAARGRRTRAPRCPGRGRRCRSSRAAPSGSRGRPRGAAACRSNSSRSRRSISSTIAPTWRSVGAEQTRNTSVIARWSETSKATMFWASFSSAASAAAMVSSTARSDAVTGGSFLRVARLRASPAPPSHGRGAALSRGSRRRGSPARRRRLALRGLPDGRGGQAQRRGDRGALRRGPSGTRRGSGRPRSA